jgi:SAM-dependent methyltransferase
MGNISIGTKLRKAVRARGVFGVVAAAVPIVFPPKATTLTTCRNLVADRTGLEIGGPSGGLQPNGVLPLYQAVAKLDNCNFGYKTVWEPSLAEGFRFEFAPNKPKGRQFVCEATNLEMIPDKAYDFVVSCHALEHTANPLRALKEWIRVLKDDGGAVLILPHKEGTLDHRRPVTTLQHLIQDLQNDTKEDDLTHLPEVLELTDLDRDWGVLDHDDFKQRCEKNSENRCIHQHVFVTSLVIQMFDYLGMQVLSAESVRPFHIIVSSKKLPQGEQPENEPFLSASAAWRKNSPFKADRA